LRRLFRASFEFTQDLRRVCGESENDEHDNAGDDDEHDNVGENDERDNAGDNDEHDNVGDNDEHEGDERYCRQSRP
jgi:hypothetical protein